MSLILFSMNGYLAIFQRGVDWEKGGMLCVLWNHRDVIPSQHSWPFWRVPGSIHSYYLPRHVWPFLRVPGSTHSCILKGTRKGNFWFHSWPKYLLLHMYVAPLSKGMRRAFFISIHKEPYVCMYVSSSCKDSMLLPNTKELERVGVHTWSILVYLWANTSCDRMDMDM